MTPSFGPDVVVVPPPESRWPTLAVVGQRWPELAVMGLVSPYGVLVTRDVCWRHGTRRWWVLLGQYRVPGVENAVYTDAGDTKRVLVGQYGVLGVEMQSWRGETDPGGCQ